MALKITDTMLHIICTSQENYHPPIPSYNKVITNHKHQPKPEYPSCPLASLLLAAHGASC